MSGDQLFDDAEMFTGDPLYPDVVQVCPPSIIATLTKPQREERVQHLINQAHDIVDSAWELAGGRMRAAWCVLYSGGNDSTVLTHLMKERVDYAVHCNTTIGIEDTRQFVRDTCQGWGLELLERTAPQSYRDLVLERGFPGPGMHFKMYQRLKERALDEVRRDLVNDTRKERVLFIAGRRRAESKRRQNIPLYEVDGSAIWAAPMAMWTKLDMNTYRLMADKDGGAYVGGAYVPTVSEARIAAQLKGVPINPVSENLHMSGECLCGAFAKKGELDEIRFWYPAMAEEIDQLERDVTAAGHKAPFNKWGHGQGKPTEQTGALCTSCTFDQPSMFEQEAS